MSVDDVTRLAAIALAFFIVYTCRGMSAKGTPWASVIICGTPWVVAGVVAVYAIGAGS